MPTTSNGQPLTGPLRRRTVLSAGAGAGTVLLSGAVLLSACSDGAERGPEAARSERLRARAARDTSALLSAYDATIAAHPGLAEALRPLHADLADHLEAFGGTRRSPSPAAHDVPERPDAARRALADTEQRSVDARAADLLDAPPDLARLLASVVASRAGHVLLLRS